MFCNRTARFNPATDIPELDDKVILVTGGNAGLGFQTILQLARHNPAHIYLAARSRDKGERAIAELESKVPNCCPISFLSLNLASFTSIRAAVATFRSRESRLDLLVNNAGIMMTPEGLTEQGYEIQFGTNHMGHAYLTRLLLPTLQTTATARLSDARVVTVASASEGLGPSDVYKFHEFKTTMPARRTTARYCISKLANVHYSQSLAEHHQDVKFICVHPGMASTTLNKDIQGFFLNAFIITWSRLFGTNAATGALNQIWASVSPDAESGEYYGPVGVAGKGSKYSQDGELRAQLWAWTQVELDMYENGLRKYPK